MAVSYFFPGQGGSRGGPGPYLYSSLINTLPYNWFTAMQGLVPPGVSKRVAVAKSDLWLLDANVCFRATLRPGPQKIRLAEHALAGVPTPDVRNRFLASAACKFEFPLQDALLVSLKMRESSF